MHTPRVGKHTHAQYALHMNDYYTITHTRIILSALSSNSVHEFVSFCRFLPKVHLEFVFFISFVVGPVFLRVRRFHIEKCSSPEVHLRFTTVDMSSDLTFNRSLLFCHSERARLLLPSPPPPPSYARSFFIEIVQIPTFYHLVIIFSFYVFQRKLLFHSKWPRSSFITMIIQRTHTKVLSCRPNSDGSCVIVTTFAELVTKSPNPVDLLSKI